MCDMLALAGTSLWDRDPHTAEDEDISLLSIYRNLRFEEMLLDSPATMLHFNGGLKQWSCFGDNLQFR